MVQKLLVVVAVAALISFASFTVLTAMGGFPRSGPFRDTWRGWRHETWNANSPQATRDLPYSGGYRLSVGYPADITVTQGPQARFTVTGPKDLIDRLSIDDGRLDGPQGPIWTWGGGSPHDRLRINVVTPDTREFHLSDMQKLTLRNYDQDSLTLRISGSADVDGQGKAKRLETRISGSGRLRLTQLPVDSAEVSISGSGDADLDARVSSDVRVSGSGRVRFACRPAHTGLRRSGFADVDYGPDCAAATPPATAPAAPTAPAPKPAA